MMGSRTEASGSRSCDGAPPLEAPNIHHVYFRPPSPPFPRAWLPFSQPQGCSSFPEGGTRSRRAPPLCGGRQRAARPHRSNVRAAGSTQKERGSTAAWLPAASSAQREVPQVVQRQRHRERQSACVKRSAWPARIRQRDDLQSFDSCSLPPPPFPPVPLHLLNI